MPPLVVRSNNLESFCRTSDSVGSKMLLCSTMYNTKSCVNGENCPYAHDEDDLVIDSKILEKNEPNNMMKKMCLHKKMGFCAKGKFCHFAHSEDEIMDQFKYCKYGLKCIGYATGSCLRGEHSIKSKSVPCFNLLKYDICHNNIKGVCGYAHNVEEWNPPERYKNLCSYYTCNHGVECNLHKYGLCSLKHKEKDEEKDEEIKPPPGLPHPLPKERLTRESLSTDIIYNQFMSYLYDERFKIELMIYLMTCNNVVDN